MASYSNEYLGSSSSSSAGVAASGSSAFLEELQARGIGVDQFHTEDTESRVMIALSDGAEKDIAQIMSESGCIPLGRLLTTIEKLEHFGLMTKNGPLGDEKFRLSSSGVRAAEMMGVWRGKI